MTKIEILQKFFSQTFPGLSTNTQHIHIHMIVAGVKALSAWQLFSSFPLSSSSLTVDQILKHALQPFPPSSTSNLLKNSVISSTLFLSTLYLSFVSYSSLSHSYFYSTSPLSSKLRLLLSLITFNKIPALPSTIKTNHLALDAAGARGERERELKASAMIDAFSMRGGRRDRRRNRQ